MKIAQLRLFLTLAEAGGLTAAGEKLGRTPAAVSMGLKQLEEDLGGSLFEGERKARLSALGQFVYERTRDVVAGFDASVEEIRSFARGGQGVVKVAAVPTAANRLLPLMTSMMRASHRGIRLELRETDSAAVEAAVSTGDADFGIGSPPSELRHLHTLPLISDPYVLVCPRDHPLTRLGRPIEWGDLHGHELIANGLIERLGSTELRAIAAASRLVIHSTTSLLTHVERGAGITVLPRLSVLDTPRLACLPLVDASTLRRIDLLKRHGKSLQPAASLFYQCAIRCAMDLLEAQTS